MPKSPLSVAISMALLFSHIVHAQSDEPRDPFNHISSVYDYMDPNELSDYDRAAAKAKRSAITGLLYEEAQLNELRGILEVHEKNRQLDTTMRQEFPLEADEITTLRKKFAEIERAKNQPLSSNTSFNIRNISFNPDSNKPLLISVSPGYSSQIEFYDSTGKPWPIAEDGVIGDGETFSKQILGRDKHIASFVLTRNYRQSNAAVILEGLPASIPILLQGTDSTVDGRVTVNLPRLGPNTDVMPVFSHEIDNVSPELVRLQGGNAPSGSRVLKVAGISSAESWFDGDHLYLSLPGRLLLPPPINSSISPTGRFLYKVAPTPYIMVSLNGERVGGTIENVYQTDIRRAPSVFEGKK